jgi:antitoxin component YwqK of YwqJK toxin-antitoxin module
MYKNGERNGISRVFRNNGSLLYEQSYKDDKLNGISTAYYQNGKLKEKATYTNGKLLSGYHLKNGLKIKFSNTLIYNYNKNTGQK